MGFIESNIKFISRFWVSYAQGVGVTLLLSILGVIFGSLLGIFVCKLRMSKNNILRNIGNVYVEIIRGTPLMVQLLIVYFGLKSIIPEGLTLLRGQIFLCSVAIVLNAGAYIAEIVRGGIESIDKGQHEAGRSLGLSEKQTMKQIILPQAIKNILPALGNEFVALIKETAIVTTVGVSDIIHQANIIRSGYFKPLMPYMYAALCYFILTFTLTRIMKVWERRLAND